MLGPTDPTAGLAIDTKDLGALRRSAEQQSPEALKATAKQFEALFMNMVLKSMREATPQDGIFDSQQGKMYTSMLDQQLSQTMASRGVGLADVLVRQLSNMGSPSPLEAGARTQAAALTDAASAGGSSGAVTGSGKPAADLPAHVRAFQQMLAPHAEETSRETGIPAKFMLGQAALETGWGKHQPRAADGSPSYNLFGLKAGGSWKGRVVETATTEYVNGVPQTKIEKFRAYDSYADAFHDYAHLLSSNPRYQGVIASSNDAVGFAQGLQRAGYATDPNYAAKLTRIINNSLTA